MGRCDYADFTECRALLKEILLDGSFPAEDLRGIVDEARGLAGRAEFAEFDEREQYPSRLKQLLLTAPSGDWLGDLLRTTAWVIGNEVFQWEWDSGGAGAGAGEVSVCRLGDRFVSTSDDLGVTGPFETLQDALALEMPLTEEGLLKIGEEAVAIDCTEWTTEELILRLDLDSSNPRASFDLNGEHWYLEEVEHEQEKLRRARVVMDA